MVAALDGVAVLEAALKSLAHPAVAAVAAWDVRIGDDWSGDPAVYVTVTFRDADVREAWPSRDSLVAAIEEQAQREFPGRLPYVILTAESDAVDPDPGATHRRAR